jgi:TonB family protein
MGLVTLLAVSLIGSAPADQAPGATILVVDTSAVSPPLRVRHGSIDLEKVREVVSAQRAEIQSCYERGLLENPNLSGTWTVRIVIAGNGAVGTASMQGSTLHWLPMERCLLELVRTWRFPPPADGKTAAVDYPFTFRKEAPDAGS